MLVGTESLFSSRMAALLPTAAESWDEQRIVGASLGTES